MQTGPGGEQTRLRLLTAAAEEILACGYAGASLSRIGNRMGVTKGALSHHFPSKAGILAALVDHAVLAVAEIADQSDAVFPASPIRACVRLLAGTAVGLRADPVLGAAIHAFQDPSIDSDRVLPLRSAMGTMLKERLLGAEEREGYDLSMDIDDAVQFLQVLLAGFLSSARFVDSFRPHQEPLFVRSALQAMGIADADIIVSDALRSLARG